MELTKIVDRRDYHILNRKLKQINRLAPQMAALTDEQLQHKTVEFKERLAQKATLDELLPEAFAAIREAAKRVLGMFPYDVQVLGGIIMHGGNIAEMKTGEGKTLTAVMPLYLNALSGKSTILVTPNEYLAQRDASEMGPLYEFMGLSLGCRAGEEQEELKPHDKRYIYQQDIVYTTNATLGFDYLIDNLAETVDKKFMPEFNYVIIDEADAILLDSAQTPLIISGAPRVQSNLYGLVDNFILTLEEDQAYKLDEKRESVWLTPAGIAEAEQYFSVSKLYDGTHTELIKHINLALRAHLLFENGKDYVVRDGEVVLLDDKDGRILEMTKLQGGQHQALEAKEHVKITHNMRAMASITYQNLFKLFQKRAGMSGTAKTAEDELIEVYQMKVLPVPTNNPVQRIDEPDEVYLTLPEKLRASMEVVKKLHAKGQPLLIATGSVELSEIYSELLLAEMIPHSVLNAYNDAKEAQIIKEAGQKGSVTVATLMAGRGTDIKLGPGVKELGGLAVIGTEKMLNERMELQLRGRAGRQGDPGYSKFFVSLEDEVVQKNSAKRIEKYWRKHKDQPSNRPLRSKYRKIVASAQIASDNSARKQRQLTLAFDESVKTQREKVYHQRDEFIFQADDFDYDVLALIEADVDEFLQQSGTTKAQIERYIFDNISYEAHFLPEEVDNAQAKETILQLARTELERKADILKDPVQLRNFYRLCLLKAIDTSWIEEVDTLEQLKNLITARTSAQRNPVYEYHFEAKRAYQAMQANLRRLALQNLLLSTITVKKDGSLDIYFA
ncbi:MAG: accessory Sec system translocase SecA2 [Ligilactobacillus animalis]|uniref:accessory Sec system translocase SecA2 n=1 Tax=Ligilactobacillus animalis TaxID=1605 RepID=UPI0024319FBF|nr:accessory Sec system translocase SecA2 [Ligilactobacillus animalis]MCI5941562.1 accessory Sec system translocase SecA2 [Ligilactobacillus animalis]MDY2992351.1 accessory Sec system translocase SecA2 [Ligilactobacillus animalis]